MIDIKNKKCKENNCNKRPSYSYINNNPNYCLEHKKDKMINVVSKRCLVVKYLYYNKIGIFCLEHKKDNMINVKDKKCKECNDTQISNKKYKDYCLRCFMFKFPNEKVARNYYKIKENQIF